MGEQSQASTDPKGGAGLQDCVKGRQEIGALAPEVLNKTLAEYKNPQQEPGTERRLLLVFVLTFVVLIIFQPLLKKFFPQAPTPQTQTQPAATPITIS